MMALKFLLPTPAASVIFLLFSCSLFVGSAPSDSVTDHEALMSFKSLVSDPSGSLASWNQSSSYCNWKGVSCNNGTRRVIGIDLQGLQLKGPVTSSIGNISFLEFLYLQNNKFSGSLTENIGGLSRLKFLNLSSNAIGGAIPMNITKCSSLEVIDLTDNEVTGTIPPELDRLYHLKVLNLAHNNLSGIIPPALGNLSSLTTLNLGTNSLHGPISEVLSRLRNLQHLQISSNSLSGSVPTSLYNMSSISTFALASNQLWGEIPADIGFTMPKMLSFHNCFNKFTGTIPPSLHNLTKIQSIRMSHNLLRGAVPGGLERLADLVFYNIGFNHLINSKEKGLSLLKSLTNATKLENLAIDGNLFEGEIPASVGNLSRQLAKLYMGGNMISGWIPAEIGQLKSLTLLNLSHNSMEGNMPPEIGGLPKLQALILAGNKFSGEIPTSIGNLTKLSKLDLSVNNFMGVIPFSFRNFGSLQSFDVSKNNLNGSIPEEIFQLPSLSLLLNLSQNSLTGKLPVSIGSLANVAVIDISRNHLSGEIPDSIQNCKSLQGLLLNGNALSGGIPKSLSQLKGLQYLDLSSNDLSGAIPVQLGLLNDLQLLNLSFNNLEGEVPNSGVFLEFNRIDLEGNDRVCGGPKVLMLPACHSHVHPKRRTLALKLGIALASFAIIFILLSCAWLVLSSGKKIQPAIKSVHSFKGQHQMITYHEILALTSNFSLENLLGSGSFGSVFRGVLGDGTAVATKVIDLQRHGAATSFAAECEALRGIRHRNLIKLITACSGINFKNEDFKALVYEYMVNGNLEQWLYPDSNHGRGDKAALGLLSRLNIAIDVACALDYLHHDSVTPVVHCDLKPSNVLLDDDMTAKVGDFGLARLLDEGSLVNQLSTGGLKGSIGYIAPEYGMGGKPTTQGDVYSYGILLLELFTGKRPTHEIFSADLNLQKWVRERIPGNIMEIVQDEVRMSVIRCGEIAIQEQQIACLIAVIEVALSCAVECAHDRMTMRMILPKLKRIRDSLA
ncbi:probable LRR receptor-like serine/threonine-protein kinase At3g47570 [Nymphaea colorata]|nr:probable LRR receptor-like serine/threonine-protein kinase At3g47570 [Nymphaea colorata]